jgi:acetyl esterase/lipase
MTSNDRQFGTCAVINALNKRPWFGNRKCSNSCATTKSWKRPSRSIRSAAKVIVETLLADATRFAAAAGAADVPMTLEIWPHMIHAWHLWNAHLEPGRRALANAGSFIRECL